MVLEGLCLTRRGAGALIMAWGPPALLLLAWMVLSCVAGVQGRWDGAVEIAGPGRVRRRGSPGILQGCVVPRMLRLLGCGLGWAVLGGKGRGPGVIQLSRVSPAMPCSPQGLMCVAPASTPTAAQVGGRCLAGTSVSCVSTAAMWRWGAHRQGTLV